MSALKRYFGASRDRLIQAGLLLTLVLLAGKALVQRILRRD